MDTTERLQGVVDIIFEKAICEPKFASTYARMCRCLKENPGSNPESARRRPHWSAYAACCPPVSKLDCDKAKNNWSPRSSDQGPKTINQVHKHAELETELERSNPRAAGTTGTGTVGNSKAMVKTSVGTVGNSKATVDNSVGTVGNSKAMVDNSRGTVWNVRTAEERSV
ncbi:hypothetical protein SKAU_G00398100 [Synaphobranchus kaupii]|uniref:MIF4G domain-containing protein n=1 Tax=Synaphobranchus kaupii TaxID=118154 RepID=A0A9Q1IC39_SYNKA|nr:hypothetical protein SKAU_G00398100 [Synaphobranchus kaupii]